ncbi:metallophosphoesterase family protein [Lacibacter sp. H407]|uniref:metallophosphoesterase family protein n=1 Tax=Lacibacter sp. H407 TaxID=3133423 RepID=UPI0030BBDF97
MKRSDFLQTSAALVGSSLLPFHSSAENSKTGKIRFAYVTDIHVKPDAVAEAGMAKAFQHVQSLKEKVDFIINGGDSIMDSLDADKQKTKTQWDLFHSILKKENSLPVYHCIGNHDVWGWFIKNDRPEADKLYGKQWVVETLALPKRYYSFTKNKWQFIILDSTQLNPAGGYIAYVDPAQLDWLQQELNNAKDKFICIVSHIPILSICAGLFFNKTEANGDLKIQRNLMHTDFFALKKLFLGNPNIKVCLSGHIHLQDEVDYLGVKYFCNGAVSGNWWKGAFQEFEPAYAVFDFYDDGTFARKMMKLS